ncbi:MAG: 2-C-methyl-D-erythritol 2,4-cyclodiphosphate synthase [Candidatus Omnitrophota bacterium]|jgi:2-C-methyl-D-erythritol 2,4-cyclodiphosphate synthase
MMRIGIGYDIHRLVKGRKLFLGGIEIPHSKGLLGHSDGDALLHAVCDALLGAVNAGDIGGHFPDTDRRYNGIDSAGLLKKCAEIVKSKGFSVGNLDAVIIAESPKLFDYKKAMGAKIAGLLRIPADQVSIKAKTGEGLGEIGKGKAIAAYSVVMVTGRGSSRRK